MSACVILGSAFAGDVGLARLEPVKVRTRHGDAVMHRDPATGGYVVYRHGSPHQWLPHQIPYRALVAAIAEVGCTALLVTTSAGVLVPDVPLFVPHLIDDLIMMDNRLPDGSACTMFPEPQAGQGHLVVSEGLFRRPLSDWLRSRFSLPQRALTFLYVPGPRTKTAAENRYAATLGAEVNSMTLAPEVVLANELEIPVAGLAVGHKYSLPEHDPDASMTIAESLVACRSVVVDIAKVFLESAPSVGFGNHIHRFADVQDTEREG